MGNPSHLYTGVCIDGVSKGLSSPASPCHSISLTLSWQILTLNYLRLDHQGAQLVFSSLKARSESVSRLMPAQRLPDKWERIREIPNGSCVSQRTGA